MRAPGVQVSPGAEAGCLDGMIAALALSVLAALAPTASPAGAAPRTFDVGPASTLRYRLVHKFHAVEGTSRAVEGKARVLPDGTVQVMVRAPLDSFHSGNSNRDAHMLEVTGAARQPYVIFKGVGHLDPPDRYPVDVRVQLRGELTLKSPRPVEAAAAVHFDGPDRAHVEATFPVSLDAHQVERPELLFVKVDDRVDVDARLELEVER
ncbi:YceI family protein [Anaeromyxobacter dehalogenans]|uniref:YceI family protein n=1 Tax=Anaeromyxobacter dehalogenans TaxID=161493 RepID=UPI001FE1DCDD|nr:YceI family protein [Anaeromyxobacter dehalogenans]